MTRLHQFRVCCGFTSTYICVVGRSDLTSEAHESKKLGFQYIVPESGVPRGPGLAEVCTTQFMRLNC